jgi:probable rRNA maturation factor
MESNTVSITKITKGKVPSLPFSAVKDYVLGKKYDLSLVFADEKTAQNLNIERRGKDYVPNILSFPYGKDFGEIFIHLPTAKKQAPDFEMGFEEYILFLFIHGCLHLKGMEHSSTMEKRERTILNKFRDIKQPKK